MIESNHNIRIRVAGIIIEEDKILLIAHKKDGKIYWLVPGGGVDYGESLNESLVREYKEELNIKIAVSQPVLMCDSIDLDSGRHIVNVFFECTNIEGELQLSKEERLYDFAYFSVNDLKNLTVYPPVNNELIKIIENKNEELYLGKMWK